VSLLLIKCLSHPSSTVFELPDELILSILSHICPESQVTGQYTRFRVQYFMEVDHDYYWRAQFLRRLSMTCKAMRLRLLPWIWGHIVPSLRCYCGSGTGSKNLRQNFDTILRASYADAFLAASVKCFSSLLYSWVWADLCP